MSRKPFSRKRQRIFEGATIVCPKCNGSGSIMKDHPFAAMGHPYDKKQDWRCPLCKRSGRVFPTEAMEFILSQT